MDTCSSKYQRVEWIHFRPCFSVALIEVQPEEVISVSDDMLGITAFEGNFMGFLHKRLNSSSCFLCRSSQGIDERV